ncbi:MAG: phytanoyl-CoA dioxygenase family protein, partial [Abitibacteriaceae bacterium]|nr:phytanoyl-CoA dioxygenase family protein [Abditibacteriaceae bacterium]
WPDLEQPTPAFGLVVNVPVVDMDAQNGSTEIWPGTHLDPTCSIHEGSQRIPQTILEPRRAIYPPIQPTVPAGSVVIRDIRLWHAGMPNHTDQPRPMIAMIHWCSWWANDEPISFPKGTEEFFTHPILKTNARFVEGDINYLLHNKAYDLQK